MAKGFRLIQRGFDQSQSNVASGTSIALAGGGRVYRVTGTTTINIIRAPAAGSPVVTLIFAASVTVNDEGTSSGNLRLAGAANFSATADDTLTLVWNQLDSKWHEAGRSVN